MSKSSSNIIVTSSEEGEILPVAGGQYRILIGGGSTDGKYAVIEMNVPPGGGPAPHAHPEIEEMFYVVGGEVNFKTEAGHYSAKKGAFIHIPFNGGVHAFKNQSSQIAKLICTVIPAGLDSLFREVAAAGPGQARAISERFGHTVYPADFLDTP